jgi:hypothetical protein
MWKKSGAWFYRELPTSSRRPSSAQSHDLEMLSNGGGGSLMQMPFSADNSPLPSRRMAGSAGSNLGGVGGGGEHHDRSSRMMFNDLVQQAAAAGSSNVAAGPPTTTNIGNNIRATASAVRDFSIKSRQNPFQTTSSEVQR